jgi:hypothetical protein
MKPGCDRVDSVASSEKKNMKDEKVHNTHEEKDQCKSEKK